MEKLEALEKEARQKEKKLKEKEKAKKQVLLRLAPSLWNELAQWADEDYRSINGQIEFLLAEAVRKRKNGYR
ncbi:MAG: Arc family DNA-binding protein [Lachnospiraceae bacterium]|nr:Arc family DNA-binding protein [Lachnospiraceae bacterium]